MQPGCRTPAKWAGKIGIRIYTDKHTRRFPHHIMIIRECKIVDVVKRDDPQLPPATDADEIPF